ncbi:unnamed protein product [Dicrocoelium dendriticum]|nr:unnamed protein product [Dicrocoelium dendriticum]
MLLIDCPKETVYIQPLRRIQPQHIMEERQHPAHYDYFKSPCKQQSPRTTQIKKAMLLELGFLSGHFWHWCDNIWTGKPGMDVDRRCKTTASNGVMVLLLSEHNLCDISLLPQRGME